MNLILKSRNKGLITGLFLLSQLYSCRFYEPITVDNLKTNYAVNPIGVDEKPYLSWKISSSLDSVSQTAYQILAASSPEKLNERDFDLWNSGKVNSENSVAISYEGKQLSSRDRVFWKVKVWDQEGKESNFSDVSWFEMGLINQEDWVAKWISAVEETDSVPPVLPSPYFRKEFSVQNEIAKARLYISGVGYFETFINGQKVGDHVLDPMMTRYDERVKYVSYDVTDLLSSGKNAVGVVLGNGWYNQHTRTAWNFDQAPWRESPAMIYQLEIIDSEGNHQVIHSDESWKYSTGPIVFNGIHNGETYDARLELGNWSSAGYNDKNWEPPIVVKGPAGKLSSQKMPPIRVVKTLKPNKTWKINDSISMIDLGQNITGWGKIKVKGPKGTMVKLRYGERIYEDSTLDQKELSRFIWTGDTQTDRYILKGEGLEEWHPVFTYHGFQFIEVTKSHPDIEILEVGADVVRSDLQRKGSFSCSNDMFNQLHKNIEWSFLGNYHGYPTDCPHREKMGWTGDALLVAETGLFNFDMINAYLKWTDDFVDEMQDNGQLPGIVPTSGWGYTYGKKDNRERGYGPQWEGAFMEVPWQVYRYTGDTSIIEKYYPHFKTYVDYLTAQSEGHLLNFGIDDHKQLVNLTMEDYLSSAFYYYLTDILRKMSNIIGNDDEAMVYAELASKIKSAFNQKYYDPNTGLYDHGGQTPMALALQFGLVEKEDEEKVLDNLIQVIKEKNGHIDAGVVGTKAVVNALMKYGKEQVLFEMADKRTFPGWGYWVDVLGANTMFQNWNGSQSRNHIMFGTIGDYFFKGLAGINIDDQNPGFKNIIIKPSFNNDVNWVEAGYESVHGTITSHWKKEGDNINMIVTVPPNCTADILMPKASYITLNGKEIQNSKFEEHRDLFGTFSKIKVGSGTYKLVITSINN